MPYTYQYPRPMVTVDIFLLRFEEALQLLLIQRKNAPFAGFWALPGGFLDENESPESAAERELAEETGLSMPGLVQLQSFGDPGRDPRGHTVTIVFGGFVSPGCELNPAAGDDAKSLGWFPMDNLPKLAFDHEKIIATCLRKVENHTLLKFW